LFNFSEVARLKLRVEEEGRLLHTGEDYWALLATLLVSTDLIQNVLVDPFLCIGATGGAQLVVLEQAVRFLFHLHLSASVGEQPHFLLDEVRQMLLSDQFGLLVICEGNLWNFQDYIFFLMVDYRTILGIALWVQEVLSHLGLPS